MPTRKILGLVPLSLTFISMLAACSGSPASPAAANRTAPQSSAVMPTPAAIASSTMDPAARAALAAYRDMWTDFAAVADSGNYQQARLGDHMTGELLLDSSQNLYLTEQRGIVGRGAPRLLRPQVQTEKLSADPPLITISDCVDGRAFLFYYASTGKPVDEVPGGLQAATIQMTLVGGVWKASTEQLGAEGSCTG